MGRRQVREGHSIAGEGKTGPSLSPSFLCAVFLGVSKPVVMGGVYISKRRTVQCKGSTKIDSKEICHLQRKQQKEEHGGMYTRDMSVEIRDMPLSLSHCFMPMVRVQDIETGQDIKPAQGKGHLLAGGDTLDWLEHRTSE